MTRQRDSVASETGGPHRGAGFTGTPQNSNIPLRPPKGSTETIVEQHR